MIELRSDTFTVPTQGMLQAMMAAPVGDDVFSEDPSVNRLEAEVAAMFGMEAALFCPSGTMTNQIGIQVHTRPGDEVICEEMSHVYIYEGGGIAFNSGCQARPLRGDRGRLSAAQVAAAINPDDVHKARTRVVSLENTTNRGGGACYELSEIEAIREVCDRHGLALHLDGARLWNALVARGESPQTYGALFDTISVCLSKGLGAPVGSLLLGSHSLIREARRVRKKLGGGMRQAGYLAAAALYALQHHFDRLSEDHTNARRVAATLEQLPFCGEILPPETNILIFSVKAPYTAAALAARLEGLGVRCIAISATQIRMVFHLGVTASMTDDVIAALQSCAVESPATA